MAISAPNLCRFTEPHDVQDMAVEGWERLLASPKCLHCGAGLTVGTQRTSRKNRKQGGKTPGRGSGKNLQEPRRTAKNPSAGMPGRGKRERRRSTGMKMFRKCEQAAEQGDTEGMAGRKLR